MAKPFHFQRHACLVSAIVLALYIAPGLASAALSKDDQKCINEINKSASKVAKAVCGDISSCLKNVGKEKTTDTWTECIASDPKGKQAKATGKLTSKVSSKCLSDPNFPSIDTSDTAGMNARAIAKELAILEAIMGTDVDGAVALCDPDKDDCKCQQAVIKQAWKCQGSKLKDFIACKKNGLKGKNGPAFESALELQNACLGTNGTGESIPDSKGKQQKDCFTKLDSTIGKKCPATDIDLFPGCGTVDAAGLSACIDLIVECEVCRFLNDLDNLGRNCDEFDNGVEDGSCPGAGPAPKDLDADGHITTIEDCLGSDPADPNSTPESFVLDDSCDDDIDNDKDGQTDGDDDGCSPETVAVETYPAAGLDVFESSLSLDDYPLATPFGVCVVDFEGDGPVCVTRSTAVDIGGGKREIDTEIIAMQLTGLATIVVDPNFPDCTLPSGSLGTITLCEDPEQASAGKVTDTTSDPNTDFPSDSFFDVFFQIVIPSVGTLPGGPPGGPAGDAVNMVNNGINILPPFNTPNNACLNPNHPNPNCYAVPGLAHDHCPEPPDFLDHFKVWEVDDEVRSVAVLLEDQFGDDPNYDIEALDKFANPVQKTVGTQVFEIFDPLAHLTWYRLAATDTPLRSVNIRNQFEETALLVDDPTHLLVPTAKNEFCPPIELDHFKCYDVIADPNTVTATGVRLQDQFDDPNEEVVDVREPVKFCNPVNKNGEGILDPEDHLTCYRIVPQVAKNIQATVENQIDPNGQVIDVRENVYLCVPTRKVDFLSCGGSFPTCDGPCPEGTGCADTGGECECVPSGAPFCGDSLAPQCDGGCAPAEMCVENFGICECQPSGGQPCGTVMAAPLCYGECPPGEACVDDLGTCVCMP